MGATSTWQSAGPQPVNSEDPTYQDPVVNNFGAGWGIDAGRVTAVTVDPRDDDTVYMGAADGGIWKTTDGGATWASIGDELDTQAIGAIAVATRRPDTLYVGTGEAVTSQDAYFGLGIFRSTDGGATFTKVGGTLFDRKTVFKILAPANGRFVFAATNQGLYRSSNSGEHVDARPRPRRHEHVRQLRERRDQPRRGRHAGCWRRSDGGEAHPRTVSISRTTAGRAGPLSARPRGFAPQERLGRMTLAQAPSAPKRLLRDRPGRRSTSTREGPTAPS